MSLKSATSKLRDSALTCQNNAADKQRWITVSLVNFAAVMERAEEQLLPSVFYFVGRSLHATPAQLGMLTLCRALVQAVMSPVGGIAGDRYDRSAVIATGCLVWGTMTAAIASCSTLHAAMLFAAINGFGLALVIPCIQSLIADLNAAETRGRAFGLMYFTASLGAMLGGLYATNIGQYIIMGIDGWRFAFYTMSCVSVTTGVLILQCASDPKHSKLSAAAPGKLDVLMDGSPQSKHDVGLKRVFQPQLQQGVSWSQQLRKMVRDVRSVVTIPTFQVIIAQGIVGSLPAQGMVFFTLYLQLAGFSDWCSSVLVATFSAGTAVGGLLGGMLGDIAARMSPDSGRVSTAQVSVAAGIPLIVLVLRGLPLPITHDAQYFWLYAFVLLLAGLLSSWCAPATNAPIFAEIVPEELRSTVYAFDRSFEGAIAACAAPLVGMLAEGVFGYKGMSRSGTGGAKTDHANAAALGSSLMVCSVVPWTACFVIYTALHWVYPRDRRRAAASAAAVRRLNGYAMDDEGWADD